jgi:AraC family transcriptional regulator of adaptative response/methylated-DNA-[protein]-cysteine methyltransferase
MPAVSGPGRLHELFVTCESYTPGEDKSRGAGLSIRYGFHPTQFGDCLLAITERGLCSLSFVSEKDYSAAFKALDATFPAAEMIEDVYATAPYVQYIFNRSAERNLSLHLLGTNFQIKVGSPSRIPWTGCQLRRYRLSIGEPGASRGGEPSSEPDRRVILVAIRKRQLRGYRYGIACKKALLGWEQAYAN